MTPQQHDREGLLLGAILAVLCLAAFEFAVWASVPEHAPSAVQVADARETWKW